MNCRLHPLRTVFITAGLACCVLLATPSSGAAELKDVMAGFDAAQVDMQTLSAKFVETTTNSLLKNPVIARGQFFLTRPDSIRWEYDTPEEMSFIIASDQYTGYFPTQKRAETRNIKRWSERIFRFIGLGQTMAELEKFYNIELEPIDEADRYKLVLEPRKRRVKKRVETVTFTLNAESFLPERVEYRAKNGDTRTIVFEEILLNPDLSTALYTIDLPADVKLVKGISGMPMLGSDATN
jgi:outer membrane lipoprotein-sorting protein